MPSRFLRLAAVSTALAAALLVVACSDDDTETLPRSTPSIDAGAAGDAATGDPATPGPDGDAAAGVDAGPDAAAAFTLMAPWAGGAAIPAMYTCNGTNRSPALSWSGAPTGTQSFAIVMRDTSLAQANNYHWIIYGIPATTSALSASIPRTTTLAEPANARQTNWSFSPLPGYGGPCPPTGTHVYEITLVALGTVLTTTSTDAATVDAAIQAAALASVRVTGTYAQL